MPSKYLNNDQRTVVIWMDEANTYMRNNRDVWGQENRKVVDEITAFVDEKLVKLLDGLDKKGTNALVAMVDRCKPVLIASDYTKKDTDDKITVDADTFYKVAEYALEHCRYQAITRHIMDMTNAKEIKRYLKENMKNCTECKDPDNCKLREELLTLMVPPFVAEGKCQWYREDGATNGKA